MNIHKIADHLNGLGDKSETGLNFDCQPIAGEVDVLQITIIGREELPVFLSVTEDQILCITYLWGEDEVIKEKRTQMLGSNAGNEHSNAIVVILKDRRQVRYLWRVVSELSI